MDDHVAKCTECEKLKQQLKKYEKAFDTLIDDSDKIKKELKTDYDKDFLIVDENKNLNELEEGKTYILEKQDQYNGYKQIADYISTGNSIYGVARTAYTVGIWAMALL